MVQPHALHALLGPPSGPSTLSVALAGASAVILPVGPLSRPANGRLPYRDGLLAHGSGYPTGGSSGSMSDAGFPIVGGLGNNGSGAANSNLEHLRQLLGALPRGVRVPVLLVAPDLQAAQQWQELVKQQQGQMSGRVGSSGSGAPLLHVVSIQQQPHRQGTSLASSGPANHNSSAGLPIANGNSSGAAAVAAASFSAQQLVQGLRWLAARAPQQPVLEVRYWPFITAAGSANRG